MAQYIMWWNPDVFLNFLLEWQEAYPDTGLFKEIQKKILQGV